MMPSHPRSYATSFRHFAAAALFALLGPALAMASSLEWTRLSAQFETSFDDESVEATYPFTNVGESAVTIVETSASCGCTIPSLEKKQYQPGESGELKAVFEIGSRQGAQRKLINVVTENADGDQNTYELTLKVDIPVPVALKPRVCFWEVGSDAPAQEVEVTFHPKLPTVLSGLKRKDADSPAAFDYEIETVVEAQKYIVRLTPKTPDQKSRDTFLLVSEEADNDILRRYPIYAYVR